jgi:capsid portal protein
MNRKASRTAARRKGSADEGIDKGTLARAAFEMVALASSGSTGGAIPTRSVFDDPFEGRKIDGMLQPRKSPMYWCLLARTSTVLPAIIRALEIGIESYGHEYVPLVTKGQDESGAEVWHATDDPRKLDVWKMIEGEDAGGDPTIIKAKSMEDVLAVELERLERYYDNFSRFQPFTDIRGMWRTDEETIGWCVQELLRDGFGIPCGGEQVPAHEVRMMVRDALPTEMVQVRIGRDWRWVTEERPYYFRRFVQIRGNQKRYYKHVCDPRSLSWKTGQYVKTGTDYEATEMIFGGKYITGEDYPEPDWASQEYNIGGEFQAERGNFRAFKNNLIPAILCVVMGGGKLGKVGIKAFLDALEQVRGNESAAAAVQIPSGVETSANASGKIDSPKMLIHVLREFQRQDMTHHQYIDDCTRAQLRAMRVPPILLGASNDYNRATAQAALEMFESQVCRPRRNRFDDSQNRIILPEMRVRFHEFRSKGPDLTDMETIARIMQAVAQPGGLSINGAIELGNKYLGTSVPPMPAEDGNLPMAVLLAKYQVQAFPLGGVGLTKDNAGKAAVAVTDLVMDALLHIRRNMSGKLEG